jgi:hypothetical protein
MRRGRPNVKKHSYDHAKRGSRQKHHRHLPRHDLNKTRPELPCLRFAVLREQLADILEPVAMG